MASEEVKRIMERLQEPFPADEISFKPGHVTANRCLAMCYIDARNVQDRLDQVLGADRWQEEYVPLPDGTIICKLSVKIGEEWVVKSDLGVPSDTPGMDAGDKRKGAFSDALKRAGVKLGIGRYLYGLKGLWADYDPARKKIVNNPALPSWALPKPVPPPIDESARSSGLAILEIASRKGLEAYELAWGALSVLQRKACKDDHPRLKEQAAKVKEKNAAVA